MSDPQETDPPSRCPCGRRVRLLWSGPLSPASRPVMLVCGWWPAPRCDLRMLVPETAVEWIGGDRPPQKDSGNP